MGVIISRFRKKESTIEVLEHIDKRITELQKFRYRNQQLKKQYIGSLILYSIVLYILAGLVFYFYYLPDTWKKRLLYSTPLLIFPVIVWLLKKFLHWYFVKRIARNDLELEEIRSKKKQILEDVMEKETYKKAKEILEKYDPDRFKKKTIVISPKTTVTPAGSALRQRSVGSKTATGPLGRGRGTPFGQATPRLPQGRGSPMQPRQIMSAGRNGQPVMSPYSHPPGPPLPRPVPPRERGKMDKLVEYFVGDGPENRYALICKYCHSHNGMALKEEFEYLSFRCCYCYQFNPARKQKPFAPKLDFAPPSTATPMSDGKGDTAVTREKQDGEKDKEEDEDEYSDEEEEEEGETNDQIAADGEGDEKTDRQTNGDSRTPTIKREGLDNLEESMDVTESMESEVTGEVNSGPDSSHVNSTGVKVIPEIHLNGHNALGATSSAPVSNGKHS